LNSAMIFVNSWKYRAFVFGDRLWFYLSAMIQCLDCFIVFNYWKIHINDILSIRTNELN